MRAVVLPVFVLALAFPAGASAEPSILIGAEIQPSTYVANGLGYTVSSVAPVCEGCKPLSGTVNGPADAVGFRAASSPYSLRYDYLLNDPCQRDPLTWDFTEKGKVKVPCPTPVYSGPVTVYLASWWFAPSTWTFFVWAERPVASCHPRASIEYDEGSPVPRPAEPQECPQERCSSSQAVTLPVAMTLACSITHGTIHRHHRRHRR